MGVGKYSPRKEAQSLVPTGTKTAEILPAAQPIVVATDDADDRKSTLQRLEEAERVAYERYVATGGVNAQRRFGSWYAIRSGSWWPISRSTLTT